MSGWIKFPLSQNSETTAKELHLTESEEKQDPTEWKVVAESREYTGILGPRRRRIQSGARDEAWSLRAFV